ncbi:MAG: GntR family transcriptional regulator [Chloroflexi bacterium]|nr:GntR family transcriptional regulator [Chloroflexota bacterium]
MTQLSGAGAVDRRTRRHGNPAERQLRVLTDASLTQTIYQLLRDRIGSHDYTPGERVRLDRLARELGVSRTPVREALNQLAAEGLIEIRPRRGTFVARADRRTIEELCQLRLMIDTFVGDLLARRITSSQLRSLRALYDKLVLLVQGDRYDDYGAYLERDRAFHSAIVRLVGNRRLTALYEEVNLPLWLVRAQQHAGTPHDASESLAEHRRILTALADRDPAAVVEAMGAHIRSSLAKLPTQLAPDAEPPG